MTKRTRKIAGLLAVVTTVSIAFSGCGKKQAKNDITFDGETEPLTLPITKEPITLKYWCAIYGQTPPMNENVVYKEIEKKTGVHIDFINPPVGQDKEQYGLMLASRDLPDLIERGDSEIYPGGVQKAVDDGVFLKLNSYIDKYAPNYKSWIEKNPKIKAAALLDTGDIGIFRCINSTSEKEPPYYGPIIRKDLLDKLGVEMPETINEWHDVLLRLKNELKIENPLSINGVPSYGFTSAFDVGTGFYNDNETIKYGPYEKNYKAVLELLRDWYAEGLIDKEFAARDSKSIETQLITGKSVAWFGAYDKMEYIYDVARASDSNYKLIAGPYLEKKKGDKTRFVLGNNLAGNPSLAVTASTKYPKEAIKWVDYCYSDDGFLFFNYGIEGKTYTLDENKKPHFTEFMTNNPDGTPFTVLEYKYKRHAGPFLRDYAATPTVENPMVKQAMDVWSNSGTIDTYLPSITFTTEEQSDMISKMTNIDTFRSEYTTKAIMGLENLDSYEETYQNRLKQFGIEDVIGYYQAAWGRYKDRLNK